MSKSKIKNEKSCLIHINFVWIKKIIKIYPLTICAMSIEIKTTTLDASLDWIELVRQKVESLRFGVVQLVVHDGRVTQIERTEKTRLPTNRDETVTR